jgi:hypothetical protein
MIQGESGGTKLCEVCLSDEAFLAYASIPSARMFDSLDNMLGLLECTPEIGRVYDPLYPAAKPPFECRVAYCGYYGIYYTYDQTAQLVKVFAIEDQRRDPEYRFAYIDLS